MPYQFHLLYKTGSASGGQDQYIGLFICGEPPDNQFSQNLSIKVRNVDITTVIFGALEEWLVWVAEWVGYPS